MIDLFVYDSTLMGNSDEKEFVIVKINNPTFIKSKDNEYLDKFEIQHQIGMVIERNPIIKFI